MGQKGSIAGSFLQGPEDYKLGVGYLIGSVLVVKHPDPVNQPAEYIIKFLYVFKQVVPFYSYTPFKQDLFKSSNC